MKLPWRARVLDILVRATSTATKTDDELIRLQRRPPLGHNLFTDALLGGVDRRVEVHDDTAAGAAGPVGIRIYRPHGADGPLPLVFQIHGGAWIGGYLNAWDWMGSRVALGTPAVVVAVDYRLAPEHRWPAAPEDCYAALVDVVGRAPEWLADPERVTVLGDSAGGNLAAAVTLMARDRAGPAIRHQVLIYPATDLTLEMPSMNDGRRTLIVNAPDLAVAVRRYLGGQNPRHPHASPLHAAALADLPAALVLVAEHDPLCDEGVAYAERLRADGIPVRLTTYVGMPHGFMAFPNIFRSSAHQAIAEICADIARTSAP
jgi:acetyl esterase/lipase